MKIKLCIMILFLCIASHLIVSAAETNEIQYGDLLYSVSNDTVTIVKYVGDDEIITIPSEIYGLQVTSIGQNAFAANTNITNVIVSEGILTIKDYAFSGCTNLVDIVLPDGLIDIANGAFQECINLTAVNLPSSILTVHAYAFGKSGIEELTIPEGVKYIDGAFCNCSALERVFLPASLEYIFPDEHIGLFYCCENLKEINVAEENVYYFSKNGIFFQRDTVKENGSRQYLYSYPAAKYGKTYTVPKNSHIMIGAFDSCKYLRNLIIPEGIKIISITASNCSKLTVTIPRSVTIFPSDGHQFDYPILKDCADCFVKVYKGSKAYKYCKKYKVPYKLIND